MSKAKCFTLIINLIAGIKCEFEPFIVGGGFASINNYPHSAFLSISCVLKDESEYSCICGSSIINQWIILTAGHCLEQCTGMSYIIINMGNEHKEKGFVTSVTNFVLHEGYQSQSNRNDIALVKSKHHLRLNSKMSRVALMRKPPYREKAQLAGWGLADERKKNVPDVLKHIDQMVWRNDDCLKLLGNMLPGTFCASSMKIGEYASRGDSGSALVVRGYIQIGLVSYKNPSKANNVIIYTDVGYFYDWIKEAAKVLYCF